MNADRATVSAREATMITDSIPWKVSQQTSGKTFTVQHARLTGEAADPSTAYFSWET